MGSKTTKLLLLDSLLQERVETILERTFDTLIMEKAALELETKFDETEKRLDKVAWKVDQLTGLEAGAGETLSTTKLIESLQDVRRDFAEVVGEVEKLKADQQEAMASILAEFQTVLKSADDMKDKLNMPPE